MDLTPYIIPYDEVHYVTAQTTIQDAYEQIQELGYRALPIIGRGQGRSLYRGTVYRSHLKEALLKGHEPTEPVIAYLRNATKFIHLDSSFYQVFFALGDRPYIAVLNDEHEFAGLLTHGDFERLTYQAWALDQSSYFITVKVPLQGRGKLAKVLQIISRHASINNVLSFNDLTNRQAAYLTFAMDESCTYRTIQRLIRQLERRHFPVIEVRDTKNLL